MSAEKIAAIQQQIFELTGELGQLLKHSRGVEVPDHRFASGSGEVSLLELFAGRDAQDWTPQYSYWRRPEVLDDGGENVVD